jgi:hypothetical protein
MAAERVRRLKDLVDRLERLPASEDRDRVLREVRSRAVDIDTGVTPRAMLSVRELIPPRAPAANRDPATSITRRSAPPPRAVEIAEPAFAGGASHDRHEWASIGRVLSLEDEPVSLDVQTLRPWRLGLRG